MSTLTGSLLVQRVQFDREILQAKKNNAYVKFEETLRMDRFFDAANPEKRAKSRTIRNQLRHCRERVATLSLPNVRDPLCRESITPLKTAGTAQPRTGRLLR